MLVASLGGEAQLHAAGLPRLKFHRLRHSCATFLLVQGVAPRVVMDILGHSQISLTMNTYSHELPATRFNPAVSRREPNSAGESPTH